MDPPSPTTSEDSLFACSSAGSDGAGEVQEVAGREVPPIEGLYVFPRFLGEEMSSEIMNSLHTTNIFLSGTRNQVMLFSPPPPLPSPLPTFLPRLITHLSTLLHPLLPPATHATLFAPSPPLARQVILNLYRPGEGITPHVDLVGRYADGIVGVCLGSGCVMDFVREREGLSETAGEEKGQGKEGREKYSVWLPERTVYCLTGEARWGWAHGIAERGYDLVHAEEEDRERSERTVMTIPRGIRVSITLRWMKEGGDVVGGDREMAM